MLILFYPEESFKKIKNIFNLIQLIKKLQVHDSKKM